MKTYKQQILEILPFTDGLSCQDITNILNSKKDKPSTYLSGSISSILNKMVKNNLISIHPTKKGIKGGKIYIA